MLFVFTFYLFLFPISIISIETPFNNNIILQPDYRSNISSRINKRACHHCLCVLKLSYSALNCFPNNTCQLFSTFSLMYRMEQKQDARLYFPRGLLPNASVCCMPDLNKLLNKLETGNMTNINVSHLRDTVIDNYGYLVTVEEQTNYLDRFYPTNLNRINQQQIPKLQQMAITYSKNAYYIAPYSDKITVIDSENLRVIANISTYTSGARDIMFLNDGQIMVHTAFDNNSLIFFNRTSLISVQYPFIFRHFCKFAGPHGMWRVNDSFFYVTSYWNNSLHSFNATKKFYTME